MPHDGEQPTSAELDFLQHEGGESLWASKGGRRPATMKRIPTVERELARKEKALAEAAALLVLKKNSKPLEVDEDVDPDEEHER